MKSITVLIAGPTFFALASSAAAFQTSTTRVSVATGGAQANQPCVRASVSADGRFVAFNSTASTLVAGDTNNVNDVFVRDRTSGTTERVSVSTGGAQTISGFVTQNASISADGRFVAFESDATNLVANDTNGYRDVFVRDRQLGTTERMSVATGGAEGIYQSQYPSLSADGRFVAFQSAADNLVAGDTNAAFDVFVHDRQLATTERVSIDSGGVQGNQTSGGVGISVSADGRFVAFESLATNLVASDTNGVYRDVYVRDRTNGTTERASVDTAGMQGDRDSYTPSISADGRFVAFFSGSFNFAGSTNLSPDIFVRDRQNGTTELVSLATGGAQANSYSEYPSISADGRLVTFQSNATNLIANDTNGDRDIFLRDRQNGTTERVSVDSGGAQGNDRSEYPSISADGRFVAFESEATNFVAGDTNAKKDIFVRDGGSLPSVYCTAGTTTNGCNASIAALLNPSLSLANSCNITVTSVEGQKLGLLFYGINNAGFTPASWAAGSTSFLCVKPPTQRTAVLSSGGTAGLCDGTLGLDWNAYHVANPTALGNPWLVGNKAYVQAWFRDPPAPKTTNLSDALELTYQP